MTPDAMDHRHKGPFFGNARRVRELPYGTPSSRCIEAVVVVVVVLGVGVVIKAEGFAVVVVVVVEVML